MEKDNFYKNSFLLTLSNLTTGILGFMFSIILSRELGAEGIGLYGLIMPIYNLFICLMCAGVITAISKISAIYFEKNDVLNLKKTIRSTMWFNITWALLIGILVFTFSSYIGTKIIKDVRTINSIKIICPAMIFISLSNILKGYFYGTSKIKIPALIDIFEKGIRISVVICLIRMFNLKDIASTVTTAYIALCIGEFLSLALLFYYYKSSLKSLPVNKTATENSAQLLFDVLVISIPLWMNGIISTTLSAASTLIVPRQLVKAGFQYENALSMIGRFNGMTLNIVFFPMIAVSSISTLLIPDLSQSLYKKDVYSVEKRIKEVIKIAFLLGLSTLIICISIPENLGYMFFKRKDLSEYIRFAALCAPFIYCSSTTYSILNGIGKQNIILRNSLITSTIELVSLYIFTSIKNINIFGYGITIIITSIISLTLNMREINKLCYIRFSVSNIIIYILTGILFYIILFYLNLFIPSNIFLIKNFIMIMVGFSLFLLFTVIN